MTTGEELKNGEFMITLKGDIDYKLTGKPGCVVNELSEYVSSYLLKYTNHELLYNGKIMELNENVDTLDKPVVFELRNKNYTESEARKHVDRVAKCLLNHGSVFEKALALKHDQLNDKLSSLIEAPKQHVLTLSSRLKSLEDITNGDLFYFFYQDDLITSNVSGFLINNKLYPNLVELLANVYQIKEFEPLQDVDSLNFTWMTYQKIPHYSFSEQFSGLNSTFQVEYNSDLNEQVQSIRESLPLDDSEESDKLTVDKNLLIIQQRFKKMAIDGVIGIVQGGLTPVNPMEPVDSHIYIWNNLFFGQVGDWYGKYVDTNYCKELANIACANKEIECISRFESLNISKVHTMMTCLVGFAGKKYLVQSVIGNSFKDMLQAPVVFGNNQDDDDFITNSKVNIKAMADALNLEMIKYTEEFESCFNKQTRITKCNDRLYLSDLLRTTPLDLTSFKRYSIANIHPIHDIMYIRHELIKSYEDSIKKPVTFALNDDPTDEPSEEIESLNIFLSRVVVPMFVIESVSTVMSIISNSKLISKMHQMGINVRYLGVIYELLQDLISSSDIKSSILRLYSDVNETNSELFKLSTACKDIELPSESFLIEKTSALIDLVSCEIVARSFKSLFVIKSKSSQLAACKEVFVDLLNNLDCSELLDIMNRKFIVQLTIPVHLALVKRICELAGVEMKRSLLVKLESGNSEVVLSDFNCFVPVTKQSSHLTNALSHFTKDAEKQRQAIYYLYGNTSIEALQMRFNTIHQVLDVLDEKTDLSQVILPILEEILVVSQYTELVTGPFSYDALLCLYTLLNVLIKGKQYEAGLATSMHIYRLQSQFYMPRSEVFSILTTMTSLANLINSDLGLELINKCKLDYGDDYSGDFEQLTAMNYYNKKQFKLAYQHQKKATKLFEKHDVRMVEDSRAMMSHFITEAVKDAKMKKLVK